MSYAIRLRRYIVWGVVLALGFLASGNAKADETDLFTTAVAPNVLIVLDNSGSMNTVNLHPDYNPGVTYSGGYSTTGVYFVSSTGTYTTSSYSSGCAGCRFTLWGGPATDGYYVRYDGNYLNWIFYHATAAELSSLPTGMRIDVAKSVVTNLVNTVTGVRFGLMDFKPNTSGDSSNTDQGGTLLAPVGSSASTLTNAISSIRANTNTPLAETLTEAYLYFQGTSSYYNPSIGSDEPVRYTSPIQYKCQYNFIIIVTDGAPTADTRFPVQILPGVNHPNTDSPCGSNADNTCLPKIAGVMQNNDCRSDLSGTQNIFTYTVGFTTGGADNTRLQDTASNGGGQYFLANNSAQLETALTNVLTSIISRSYSFTSPTVPSVRSTSGNYLYFTSFQPNSLNPVWQGDVKAYALNANGTLPVDSNGIPTGSPVWDAGVLLSTKPAASRRILTYKSGSITDFNTTNIAPSDLGLSTTTDRDNLVGFIRGTDTYDDNLNGNTTEDRPWKLGDIFHSTPVAVGSPSQFFFDDGFSGSGGFADLYKGREKVLYVGSNDGMLHAFDAGTYNSATGTYDAGTGNELWGFIPPNLLGTLKDMRTNPHKYYVDLKVSVADVWFYNNPTDTTKTADEWHTVLVGGERKGGDSYFALDVTDPSSVNYPSFLWQFTDTNLGQTWSEPVIGRIKMNVSGTIVDRWVVFFGGGWDSSSATGAGNATTRGNAFYMLDIKTGAILFKYTYGTSGDNQYMTWSLPSAPVAVDTNGDGYIDRVYIGDLGGQVWRFDFSSTDSSSWSGKRFFVANSSNTATSSQPFYYAPSVAVDSQNRLWVFFGSGDREDPQNASSANKFYGVRDESATTPLNETNLEDVTGTNTFSDPPSPYKGWFIRLGAGEKVLSKSAAFNQIVNFTTYTPTVSSDPCVRSGTSRLYSLNFESGGGASNVALVESSGFVSSAVSARSTVVGTGVASSPVLSVGADGSVVVTVGTTDGQVISSSGLSTGSLKNLLDWREVF